MSGKENNVEDDMQVVKIGTGSKRFELVEQTLERVLLRPDVRDLPVVVVSVAGAYRGGKSFILDFFLRYLNAPRSSQLNGEWLGREDEPLKGFHWVGGCDRDTTGINMWPHPVVTTLESTGEKVAVLLMDTQGTFDSESTIGDNSTIFALSTLLSSVQIYNLSGNIREDDLQHLQLFTEYGKLACETSAHKAFQTLIFLVRDWMSECDHAHGFDGGSGLLSKRLQFKEKQIEELKLVREHIRSCFDKIKCFLMPHPGLKVGGKHFTGCLSDLDEKFRLALLELVPSLFDPKHLTPKLINGERVKAKDLLQYIQNYVDIFNSDEVPQAVTIFQATAEACMMAAVREARDLYEACMAARKRDELSVVPATVTAWHCAARDEAIQLYTGKRKLGAQCDIDSHLQELKRELEGRLSLYAWNNEAKVRDTITSVKKLYEDAVSAVCEVHGRICLHPLDLSDLHADTLTVALATFDSAREVPENEVDEERATLVQSLGQQYDQLCAMNEQNNRSAVMEARDQYVSQMRTHMEHEGVSSDMLRAQSNSAREAADRLFHSRRNRVTAWEEDPYLQRLHEEISSSYAEFEKSNLKSNMMVMQAAEYKYNNYMTSAWGPQSCCFHWRALETLHKQGMQEALEQFQTNRIVTEADDYRDSLIQRLEERYTELQRTNDIVNKQAVDQAFGVYTRLMDKHTEPSVGSLLIVPFFMKLNLFLPGYHMKAKKAAKDDFMGKRRGEDYEDDEHFENLLEKIAKAYENYRHPVLAFMRELGLPSNSLLLNGA